MQAPSTVGSLTAPQNHEQGFSSSSSLTSTPSNPITNTSFQDEKISDISSKNFTYFTESPKSTVNQGPLSAHLSHTQEHFPSKIKVLSQNIFLYAPILGPTTAEMDQLDALGDFWLDPETIIARA